MKKTLFLLITLSMSLFAQLTNEFPTQSIINKKIPIVDIRTKPEWKQTGLLKNAIPITFFYAGGRYNVKKFIKELKSKVDVTKPFAIICHTGNRTAIVSDFLANQLHYKVINLKGGMNYATQVQHLKTFPYKP